MNSFERCAPSLIHRHLASVVAERDKLKDLNTKLVTAMGELYCLVPYTIPDNHPTLVKVREALELSTLNSQPSTYS